MSGLDPEQFVVTNEHLALLRRAYVGWEDCEYGAPAIDPKRPYGNSCVALDIADILGWGYDGDEGLDSDAEARASIIHAGTRVALQIALVTGSFVPGTYERSNRYTTAWKRVDQ